MRTCLQYDPRTLTVCLQQSPAASSPQQDRSDVHSTHERMHRRPSLRSNSSHGLVRLVLEMFEVAYYWAKELDDRTTCLWYRLWQPIMHLRLTAKLQILKALSAASDLRSVTTSTVHCLQCRLSHAELNSMLFTDLGSS